MTKDQQDRWKPEQAGILRACQVDKKISNMRCFHIFKFANVKIKKTIQKLIEDLDSF